MKKISRVVEKCCECPWNHCDWHGERFFCTYDRLKAPEIKVSTDFPDWCPLEDVDNAKEIVSSN